MNLTELKNSFDLVAYVSALVKLTKHSTYYIGACPMCGGRDRFTIKRGVGDVWICRKCSDGRYHSSIDFIMAYHNIDLKEALERMGSEALTTKLTPSRRGLPRPVPVQAIPSQDWQSQAWKQVNLASDRLLAHEACETGRRYLLDRNISAGAMYMWLLGYGVAYGRPAIHIPYLDVGEVITAIKYRFIDERAENDKGARFAMMAGSLACLFGLQHIQQSDHTLLFVEGELNAVSVLQTLPRGVSVISAGSESNGHVAILNALAGRYDRAVIWMDDPIKAAIIRSRMGRAAKMIRSPIINSKKWDANEMLKAGMLMDFLNNQLSVRCLGAPTIPVKTASGESEKV